MKRTAMRCPRFLQTAVQLDTIAQSTMIVAMYHDGRQRVRRRLAGIWGQHSKAQARTCARMYEM